METCTTIERTETLAQTCTAAANDNRKAHHGRRHFPGDAVARIYCPSRLPMTSGRAGTKGWRLVFEGRSAPFVDPLMGWTGSNDPLTQIELTFPTLEAATAYAEREGLAYVVQGRPACAMPMPAQPEARIRLAFTGGMVDNFDFTWLQDAYGRAMEDRFAALALEDALPDAKPAQPLAA